MLLKINMGKLANLVYISNEEHFSSKEYVVYSNHDDYKDWYDKNFITCVPIHRLKVGYSKDSIFTVKVSSKITLDTEEITFGHVHLMWDNYELVLFIFEEDMQKFEEIYELSSKILDLTNFIRIKNILLLDFVLDTK